MTTLVVVASSLLLALMIGVVELGRGRIRGGIDFLRAATGIYFTCFAVAPVYLQFADLVPIRSGSWIWMLRTPFNDPVFAYASLLGLVGYAVMLGGYWLVRPRGLRPEPTSRLVSSGYLWVSSCGLAAVGTMALVVYAKSVGGFAFFLAEGLSFRGDNPPVVSRWAFLSNVAPLVIGGMLMSFALRQYYTSGARRRAATLLCVGLYAASLAILFHQAGRAAFVAFLITLPLIGVVQQGNLRIRHVLLGIAVFAALILFGKSFFALARDPGVFLQGGLRGIEVTGAIRAIVWEFSFPIVTLANVIRSVPSELGVRWFYDIPLALAYLVPQRLTGIIHEPTITMVNTALFGLQGGIPVDLLSFGYYSMVLPGALATAAVMGALLGCGERLFPASPDPLRAGLRVSWILLLGFRIMYADPQLFWRLGLNLVIMTGVVGLPGLFRSLFPGTGPIHGQVRPGLPFLQPQFPEDGEGTQQ